PLSWEPRRMVGVAFDDGPPDDVVLAPGGRFLWLARTGDGTRAWYTTYDLERGEYGRNYDGRGVCVALHALLGIPEPRVLAPRGGLVQQSEPRGSAVPFAHQALWALPDSFAAHPSGAGLVAILRERDKGPDGSEWGLRPLPRVRWVELDPNGAL